MVECGRADGTGLLFAAYGHARGTRGGFWAVTCDGKGGEPETLLSRAVLGMFYTALGILSTLQRRV
jgi:hypothetical protein